MKGHRRPANRHMPCSHATSSFILGPLGQAKKTEFSGKPHKHTRSRRCRSWRDAKFNDESFKHICRACRERIGAEGDNTPYAGCRARLARGQTPPPTLGCPLADILGDHCSHPPRHGAARSFRRHSRSTTGFLPTLTIFAAFRHQKKVHGTLAEKKNSSRTFATFMQGRRHSELRATAASDHFGRGSSFSTANFTRI